MAQTLQVMLQAAHEKHLAASNTGNQAELAEVLVAYNGILNHAPEEPHIIFLLATVNLQLGNNGACIALTEYARTLIPEQQPELFNNIGSAWKAEHNNEKARENWLKAIELKDCGEYHSNLSTICINEGMPEKGLVHADKAVEMDPKNGKSHWNRSLLLLEAGRMEEGWSEYEWGLETMDRPNRNFSADPESIPFWDGEADLKGKTIVVYGEQGMGDEIMFASAIPDLIATGADVIYECHNRMEGLMRRSFPGITIYPTRKKNTLEWPKQHDIDYKVAIGSLFKHFRHHFDFAPDSTPYPRKPYLIPDEKLVKQYREMLGDNREPLIGFGYAGGAKKTHQHKRSSQLSPLMPILSQPATFVSLQYTPDAEDKFKRHAENTGIEVLHYADLIESHIDKDGERIKATGYDYDHTVALIAAMDLVIVPNTTAVHVCGAIGQECWTLTPDACAWRYRNAGDHMMFYGDHVKLYRGDITGNQYAIERMAEDLNNFID